jgi:HAD superfamily hydrolase (TIGR01509 family)
LAWDLVIFDCDGVLIDSEMLTIRLEVTMLSEAGITITADEIADRYCGISMKAMLADLEARYRRPLGKAFSAAHARRFAAICETELEAMPGVVALLEQLKWQRCVASSSAPDRLRHTLGLTGLYHRFDPHVFSATMVANGKPAPDLFLYAAARMGAAPARSAVIEDSVPGVRAAVAAGMTAIGFVGGAHCAPGHVDRLCNAGATVAVATMPEVLSTLRALSPQTR